MAECHDLTSDKESGDGEIRTSNEEIVEINVEGTSENVSNLREPSSGKKDSKTGKRKANEGIIFLSYFGGRRESNPGGSEKRKKQVDRHLCIYKMCHREIARGNESAKSRHGENWHKNDSAYDYNKYILPINHKDVVKILKTKKTKVSKIRDECTDNTERSEIEDDQRAIVQVNKEYEANRVSSPVNSLTADVTGEGSESILDDEREYIGLLQDISLINDHNNCLEASEPSKNVMQSTLSFKKVTESDNTAIGMSENDKPCNNGHSLKEINDKLDFLMEKMSISATSSNEKEKVETPSEAFTILKRANNILDLEGSGLVFFPGEMEGMVRCDICFTMHCENDPRLVGKDPFFLSHSNSTSCAGNTLALGLMISSSKKDLYVEGHNQSWYRLKKMLLDHISCATRAHGGDQHYQAIVAKKQRDARERTLTRVVCNQLKTALTVVKVKSGALHYEDLISLLKSCGSSVGNLGHSRKQVNPMIKAFQAYLYKRTNSILTTPLVSTGLRPHFCTTSDKSTPIKVSNHAIMVLTVVDGEKVAIPIAAPPVYEFSNSQITGGTASHLADQVIASLHTNANISQDSLSFLVGHQADGQYQAKDFIETLRNMIYMEDPTPIHFEKYFVVPWDPAHWLDCCMEDIRTKDESGEILRRLVMRVNKFHTMFGHGKGHTEYIGYSKEKELTHSSTTNYSTTRFASSSFQTFEKTYNNYEALIGAYSTLRETNDEEEEMRYLIKGRDFCIDLCGIVDILTEFMKMMVNVQAISQFIWTITKCWPRVRNRLVKQRDEFHKQKENANLTLSKDLLPKLSKHFNDLSKEDAYDCEFLNVQLTPGWIVVNESDITTLDDSS